MKKIEKNIKIKSYSRRFASTVVVIFSAVIAIIIGLNNQEVNKQGIARDCSSRFFEGEARIKVWHVGDDMGNVFVQVDGNDAAGLPEAGKDQDPYIVRVVDPSIDLKKKLEVSSETRPAIMTVRGFASTCDSLVPLVSLETATKAFKKL
ncbi:MAG TPA: hypothetical protein DIT25_03570 [Candidatus Moranbacteria bacterium]|nr:hypothetical protein [Candidatus Moranbacteria bacterium]